MKKKIRETGEIIDVITYVGGTSRTSMDKVNCFDSKGEQKCLNLNYYWDLEDLDEFNIGDYWDNLKNESTIRIYCAMLKNQTETFDSDSAIDLAIEQANKLIEKLKNQ